MKRWQETRQILGRLRELQDAGVASALATVVRVRGSAYRREGAEQVALSVVAEVVAERFGRTGGRLSDRPPAALHAAPLPRDRAVPAHATA